MKDKKRLQKEFRPKKLICTIGIIIILLGLIGGTILSYLVANKKAEDINSTKETAEYVFLNVDLVTSYFATLETDNTTQKYYFVIADDELYITKLTDDVFASLKANYDYNYTTDSSAIAPPSVTIYGYTESIPEEIKNFAIEYFKESEGLEIAPEDFEDIVYPLIIDTYKTKSATLTEIITISSIITVIGVVLVFIYIANTSKTRKTLQNYKENMADITQELNNKTTFHSELCKVYITDNYLISYKDNLVIVRLNDIVWMYPYEYHQRGVITNKSICLITKDKKKNLIGTITSWQKKKEEPYNELYQFLLKKTPDALHGYSNNNKDKMKKYLVK